MTFQSSFIVYMIALVSFVGWFLFAVFGGVGLAALPMDLITAFTGRPKPMSAEELAHEQLLLQTRVADLIEVCVCVCVLVCVCIEESPCHLS